LLTEYDYIFYVSPEGVDIEDNGVRETNSEYRNLIDITINELLHKQRSRIKNLIHIKGTTEERIALVKQSLSL
jgi:hypothetical protein